MIFAGKYSNNLQNKAIFWNFTRGLVIFSLKVEVESRVFMSIDFKTKMED